MQRRVILIALAVFLVTAAGRVDAQAGLTDAVEVVGKVTNSSRPVERAVVIALNLSDFYTTQTFTSVDGAFRLPPLPNGVYRIIAAKAGFAPAITTILPNRRAHSVNLKLEAEKGLTRDQRDEIWAVRSSLPKDILRELDAVLGAPPPVELAQPRFQAEMTSMAGVGGDLTGAMKAETALGLRSRLTESWTLDFRGSLHRLEDGGEAFRDASSVAESSGLVMELSSGPGQQYRISSTRSSWKPELEASFTEDATDLEAHNFEWRSRSAAVRVRYLAQENLFRGNENSERLEVMGDKTFIQSDRTRLGVSLSVGQENYAIGNAAMVPFRTANVAANGEFAPVRSFIVHYGVQTRVGEDAFEWAPQTAAEWRLSPRTSLIVSGLYKVHDDQAPLANLPSVIFWSDPSLNAPRYRYSVAFVSSKEGHRFSASASEAEVDSLVRIIFDEGIEQLTEGLYLEPGDIRREATISYSRGTGRWVAIDFSASAGAAEGLDNESKRYLVADLSSLYRPTRTTLDVRYRHIDQPQGFPAAIAMTRERVNFTMGQALPLPMEVRLLLGIELARLHAQAEADYQRRYVGGLSFSF
jgi:hypothetical protein